MLLSAFSERLQAWQTLTPLRFWR